MDEQLSTTLSRDKAYENYRAFRGWDALFSPTKKEVKLFNSEFSRTPIRPGAVVVDVGFGNGAFLKWVEGNGASIIGIEIQEELLTEAASRGIKTYRSLKELESASVDLITFMDVFEHLDWSEIDDCLMEAKRVLRDGGVMVARFPNCQSPVGLIEQFGDRTHKTMLSGPVFSNLLKVHKFHVLEVRGAKSMADFGSNFFEAAICTIKKLIRACAQFLFRIGFGTGNISLSPSVIVVATA